MNLRPTSPFLLLPALALLLTPLANAQSQAPPAPQDLPSHHTLPNGTALPVRIDKHLPLRVGQTIRAELIYPIYAGETLVLPAHTPVIGTVTELHSLRSKRIRATLGGDFTPFHAPVVHFTELLLPNGSSLPFSSEPAADGSPIFRAIAPPLTKGSFLRREFDKGVVVAREDAAIFLAPGRTDRLTQFVYNRLPYHPQRIEDGTAWTVETTAPLTVPTTAALPTPGVVAATPPKLHFWDKRIPQAAPPDTDPGKWTIEAYLSTALSSETSTTGEVITAEVAQPVFNPDHTVAIPQGATLVGAVTKARPARSFGRTGTLSFSFRQLTLPGGQPQNVETTLTGADSGQEIALTSEGQVKSRPQDKLSVPIFLALLAARPLHEEEGGGEQLGKNVGAGGAGLGLAGIVVGLSGASANAVAGIGAYGTALSVYDRWLKPGKKIIFARDTRIVVETTARRSALLKPDASTPQAR